MCFGVWMQMAMTLVNFEKSIFHLNAKARRRQSAVAGFLDDYQYGRASITVEDGQYLVQVLIDMPVTQNILLCVSGL